MTTTKILLCFSYKSYGSFFKNRKPKKHNQRRFHHKQTKIGKRIQMIFLLLRAAINWNIFFIQQQLSDISLCSIGVNCSELPAACITCNFNYSCIYGQMQSVTCDARANVQCHVSFNFVQRSEK